MLRGSMIFLVIAILAGLLGFWGVAGAAASIAKFPLGDFVVVFLVLLLLGLRSRRTV